MKEGHKDDHKDKIAKKMLNDKQLWYLANTSFVSEKLDIIF